MKIAIDTITVPEDRQRKTFKEIDTLADSIRRYGLLQPIIIDRDHNLIAGERRLRAHKLLDLSEIECRYYDSITAEQSAVIEYVENAQRVELSWQERCAAVAKYAALRKNVPNTLLAEELCMSEKTIRTMLLVGNEIENGDTEIAAQTTLSAAANYARRQVARAQSAENAELLEAIVGEFKETPVETAPAPVNVAPIANLDFIDWAHGYSGKLFTFIHCDFPYGINADKHKMGAAKSFGGYADSADVYWQLLSTLLDQQDNFIAQDAHMMFWFSPKYFGETKAALEAAGWTVDDYPVIWHKNDNSGIAPVPSRLPRRIYEMAFICYRGNSQIISLKSNLFSAPNIKTIHQSQKNPQMLQHFFSMFIDEKTSFLDPTCGSGMSLHAAHNCRAGYILGIERNTTFYKDACTAWSELLAEGDLFV